MPVRFTTPGLGGQNGQDVGEREWHVGVAYRRLTADKWFGDMTCEMGHRLRRLVTRPGVTPSDTSYDLWDTARPENEAGWSGAVVRIGWDAHYIVVLRASPSSPHGFAAGWMLIDVDGGRRAGPLTADQLRQRPDAAHIATYRADSAWAKLNGH